MKSSGLSSSPFFFFFLISKALNAYRLIKASTRPQLFIFFFFFFWPSHLSGCEVEDELREERLRKLWQERFVWALHASEVLNGDVSTHHFCWWRRETARAGDAILIPKGYKRQKTLIAGNCRQKSITVIEKRWKFQQLSRKKEKKPVFHMSAPRWTRNVKVFIRLIYFHGFSGAFFNLYSTAESRKMTGNVATGRWKMMTWLFF